MGGGSSSQQANTTTSTDNSTYIGGSVGLTGQQAIQALRVFRGINQDITTAGQQSMQQAYQFSTIVTQSAYANLANQIDSTRDLVQRSIAGSRGETTPILTIPTATQPRVDSAAAIKPSGPVETSKAGITVGSLLAVAGLGIGIFALTRGK